MQYTETQHQAVFGQFNGNVLVSASAGSGKTRVLVDRVINQIEQGTGIDQLLIVTFTRAAAKEMKDRIQSALQAKIQATTDRAQKQHLLKQLRKLPVADISTLDSFCQKVVQRYYYLIDLDPDFRILTDQTELMMLRDDVWSTVREDCYANDADGAFAKLTANFSNDRSDDGLTDLVYRLYDYANVNQDPNAWLASLPSLYQVGDDLVASSFYQQDLKPDLIDQLNQIEVNYKAGLTLAEEHGLEKELASLQAESAMVEQIRAALDGQKWDALRQCFAVKFERFPSAPRGADPLVKRYHDQVKDFREAAKKQLNELNAAYFASDEATNLAVMAASQSIVQKLVEVVTQFSDQYWALKRLRHCMEFIDIEHAALDIFKQVGATGNVASLFQSQYAEIMVDEYQDNNRLQDAILTTIAKHDQNGETTNMFMVGDVKQSIYRFRLAAPEMFLHRMDRYQIDDNPDQTIRLKENFRSMPNVDAFVNLIFNQIMDRTVGQIEYQGANNLVAGAKYYPADLKSNVSILLYRNAEQPAADQDPLIESAGQGQIELIAQRIQKMMHAGQQVFDRHAGQMRPMRYSDVALISATRNNNLTISDVFAQHGIPVTISGTQSYFQTTEIQIMMALLSVIDNPYQDIPLVAVLRSPIVGLNENELAYLRINSKTGDYYQAVRKFAREYPGENPTPFGDRVHTRIVNFLEQLKEFKDIAQQNQLVELIWTIYETTGFLDYVAGMPAGKQRQANLHALYERAAQYEQSSFKGLFQFVRFIERMQSGNHDLAEPATNPDSDTVAVMTIHGSKGLEFPIVFLFDANHQFNMQDTKGNFVLDDQLGLGITYFQEQNREQITTLQKQVVKHNVDNETLDEEMRKLYVALTRTEQQLFIVGAISDQKHTDEELLETWSNQAHQSSQLLLSPGLRRKAKSYLDWILPAVARHPRLQSQFTSGDALADLSADDTQLTLEFVTPDSLQDGMADQAPEQDGDWLAKLATELPAELNVDNAAQIRQVMDFKYPNQAATTTTAYQAVSEIKRAFDDPDLTQMGRLDVNDQTPQQKNRYVANQFAEPAFMQTVVKPQPTEVGTATHLVLQQLDLTQQPTAATIQELIERLVEDRVLSQPVADAINQAAILKFFDSPVGRLMLAHPDRVHREAPFSLLIAANRLFAGFADDAPERVLIHGIIDGYVELDDRVVLFDYKTDYVPQKDQPQRIEQLVQRYRGQLNLYALALTQILHRPVAERYLYLLSIDQLVPVSK